MEDLAVRERALILWFVQTGRRDTLDHTGAVRPLPRISGEDVWDSSLEVAPVQIGRGIGELRALGRGQ